MEFRQFLEQGIIGALADELGIPQNRIVGGVSIASNVTFDKGYKTLAYDVIKLIPNNHNPKYAKIRILDVGGDTAFVVKNGKIRRSNPNVGKELLITMDQLNTLQSRGLSGNSGAVPPGMGF